VVVLLVAVGVALGLILHRSSTPTLQARSPAAAPVPKVTPTLPQTVIPTLTVPQQQSSPQQATPQPAAAQAPIGPSYNWLGMQISDTSTGLTVATVAAGSAADTAGVNPGDVIEAINTTPVGSIPELLKAAGTLKLGSRFDLSVNRGSTPLTITPTLTGRPSRQS
jgi:S1-C subfamily serine protease